MTPRPRTLVLIAIGTLATLPSPAPGQVTTGTVVGTVHDSSGAVLPGATVTLSSPALPGGPATDVTRENGRFRALGLPPGAYVLDVVLRGFVPHRREAIRVQVGGTAYVDIVLALEGVTEAVTVSGEGSLVNITRAGLSTNLGEEYYENVPTRRFSSFDYTRLAPGLSATRPTSGDNQRVAAFGSPVDTNTYLVDGTDFTSPWNGVAWPWPDTDTIKEMEVISIGASAEYGNIQGAVFNVVTRQGTNRFRFDASFYYQGQGATSTPVEVDCGECGTPDGTSGFHRDRYNDLTVHAGGPIVPDKLWFYAGYQHLRDFSSQPGTDPRFPFEFSADRINWKITWQINDTMRYMHSFHDDYWGLPQPPTVADPFETTVDNSGHNPSTTFGLFTHSLAENTFYEVRVSGFYSPDDVAIPQNGSLTQPYLWETTTGRAYGGAWNFWAFYQNRTSVAAKLGHYADFLSASHDVKLGVQYTYGHADETSGWPGGMHQETRNGVPVWAELRAPSSYGGRFRTLGFFVDDRVAVGDRLTLNLGLRLDQSTANSPDVEARSPVEGGTGEVIPGLGDLYTWDVLSPRLGLAFDATGDGRTIVRASYGRFYRGVITREIDQAHPGWTPIYASETFDENGLPTDPFLLEDPTEQLQVDPDTRAPFTEQFSVGVDRQVGTQVAVGLTWVHTESRRPIGWRDVGGLYGEEQLTLPDGGQVTVYPLLNDLGDRLFVLGNRDDWKSQYDGLTFTLVKRWADDWHASASYTWSKGEGILSSSGFPVGAFNAGAAAAAFGFGKDPNDETNAGGRLPNDRTHMLRLTGAYEIPGIGVRLGINYQYLTGLPWNALVRTGDLLPQGPVNVFIEPRGTRRLAAQHLLDFRASKVFRIGEWNKLELLFDVLNASGGDYAESLIDQNPFSEGFGEGAEWVDPRRLMVGIRFSR